MKISFAKKDLRVILPAGIVTLLLFSAPRPALALFGIEDIVEPGPGFIAGMAAQYATLGHIWEQDISTYAKVLEEIRQMEKIYNTGMQTYNLGMSMSRRFENKPWRTLGYNIARVRTPNRFGETVNWDGALNTGLGAGAAWESGTFTLSDMSFAQGTAQARTLAHIEMADSAGESALATLGSCSAASTQNEATVTDLEHTILDGTEDSNTAIRQANLTNSALAQQTRMLQCTQAIQYEHAKQALVANLRARDSEAALLNTYSDAVSASTAHPSNLSGMQNTLFDAEIQ